MLRILNLAPKIFYEFFRDTWARVSPPGAAKYRGRFGFRLRRKKESLGNSTPGGSAASLCCLGSLVYLNQELSMITSILSLFVAALFVRSYLDKRAGRKAAQRWAMSLTPEQIALILKK